MADDVRLDTFTPALGDEFQVDAGQAGKFELKLTEASAGTGGENLPRDPFTLLFQGPPNPVLAQGTYLFDHPKAGRHEIFIVPIARDDEGSSYEAIFA